MSEDQWLAADEPHTMVSFLEGETTPFRTRWLGWLSMRRFPVSERKWRLFYCACCRRIAHLLPTEAARRCLATAERYADGQASAAELQASVAASMQSCREHGGRSAGAGTPRRRHEMEAVNALGRVHRTQAQGRLGTLRAAAEAYAGDAAWQTFIIHMREAPPADPLGRDIPDLFLKAQRTLDAFHLAERAAEYGRQAGFLRDIVGNPSRPAAVDLAWLAWNGGAVGKLAQAIYDERDFSRLPIVADALEEGGCTEPALLSHCRSGGGHVRGCWAVDLLLGKA